MVRKQGGLIGGHNVGENVIEKCINEIRRVDPVSKADKLLHITLKTEAYAVFVMDGYTFTTDGNGNFSSLVFSETNTPEIRELRFVNGVSNCIVCFMY